MLVRTFKAAEVHRWDMPGEYCFCTVIDGTQFKKLCSKPAKKVAEPTGMYVGICGEHWLALEAEKFMKEMESPKPPLRLALIAPGHTYVEG